MRPPEKVNILLVDDQPARLLTYESILSELGQNLVTARSGIEALEKLMRDEFAVVLLDVSMPDMDGFETARLIHEHPRFERTPIIFVTGVHMSELDRLKGYKVGAVDYVSIPVVPEILRSKVAVLVELYCKRRELRALNRNLAEANERLAMANTALQAEKTRELEALNVSLQQANAELERANAALQGEVAVRARAEDALKAGGSSQGRVSGDARARAAQPARADSQRRAADAHEAPAGPADVSGAGRDRAAAVAADAPGGRPARRVAHHPRQDQSDAASRSR